MKRFFTPCWRKADPEREASYRKKTARKDAPHSNETTLTNYTCTVFNLSLGVGRGWWFGSALNHPYSTPSVVTGVKKRFTAPCFTADPVKRFFTSPSLIVITPDIEIDDEGFLGGLVVVSRRRPLVLLPVRS